MAASIMKHPDWIMLALPGILFISIVLDNIDLLIRLKRKLLSEHAPRCIMCGVEIVELHRYVIPETGFIFKACSEFHAREFRRFPVYYFAEKIPKDITISFSTTPR